MLLGLVEAQLPREESGTDAKPFYETAGTDEWSAALDRWAERTDVDRGGDQHEREILSVARPIARLFDRIEAAILRADEYCSVRSNRWRGVVGAEAYAPLDSTILRINPVEQAQTSAV